MVNIYLEGTRQSGDGMISASPMILSACQHACAFGHVGCKGCEEIVDPPRNADSSASLHPFIEPTLPRWF